jgi:hypothetical protein
MNCLYAYLNQAALLWAGRRLCGHLLSVYNWRHNGAWNMYVSFWVGPIRKLLFFFISRNGGESFVSLNQTLNGRTSSVTCHSKIIYKHKVWSYSSRSVDGIYNYLSIDTQSIGPLGKGISPSQGRYLHTEQVGRAITQAVSTWLPTAAARVRTRVWSCWICGGQSGAGAGFLRILRFLLPIFIPPTAHLRLVQ